MTRIQAFNKISENLNDYNIVYYSEEDIYESLQDAYDEIAVYSECIEKQIEIPVDVLINNPEGALPWVHMRTLIPDYYRLIGIYNQTLKDFLIPQVDREQDEMKLDWQLGTGPATDYVINGLDWLAIPNGYTKSTNKPLRVYYKASAPLLTNDSQTFRILNDYQILIELYCTADMLEQNQEFVKAQKYWDQYEPKLEEYRQKIQLLSKSDRVFTRGIYAPCSQT